MPNLYVVDTSVLIESWFERYRPGSFPKFWVNMETAIEDGVLISPMIVSEELKRKADELHEWSDKHPKLFQPLSEEVQKAQETIVNTYPLVNLTKGRSTCDPWVIALAQINGCPVVTQEQFGSDQKPRIPDVCKSLGIGCMDVADLIEALGWTF